MGDMSKEPSMEEILSSIKRIIAEEGDEAARAATPRAPRRGRAADADAEEETGGVLRDAQVDEVLELTDAFDHDAKAAIVPEPVSYNNGEAQEMTPPDRVVAPETQSEAPSAAPADSMLSVESEVAARHSLSTLSAMLVKPQSGEDNTLEALVRELLRPMMKQWLDANLPDLVQAMVAKEIARITGREL
ncbi:DUF2497 domain-containing protein [Sphingobium sp. SCG-1]|uniref:DUF2497 domain-containing protein n=1 Tax=Sphingobium sp. SCG-1 TaxID=2072936 RepID=UPI000CD6A6A6|nr:DUF2497 domain-containing protein [Sphingobium sp. SCG-1]AUW59071.1 DUF2497 domain-containing protein [Sphingobium sp. SCG-1]